MPADTISTEQLRDLLSAGKPVTVVDIRTAADREWSIPGSLHIDAYDAVNAGSLGLFAGRDLDRTRW
jgi:rhodanese-related sulfurtransferase